MGKRLEKLKRAKVKFHKAVEKGRGYRDIAFKKGREIQAKAQQLKETYPVFGGTEELFGFGEQKRHDVRAPDLLGNVGGVGTIDFGLNDYAPRAKPVIQGVDEAAIQKEMFEHPWASRSVAAQIAKDHRKKRRR